MECHEDRTRSTRTSKRDGQSLREAAVKQANTWTSTKRPRLAVEGKKNEKNNNSEKERDPQWVKERTYSW